MKLIRDFVLSVEVITSDDLGVKDYCLGEYNSHRQAESAVLKHLKQYPNDVLEVKPYHKHYDIYGSHKYVYSFNGKDVLVSECAIK